MYSADVGKESNLTCYGADFNYYGSNSFYSLYSADSFYFDRYTAADPIIDYTQVYYLWRVPFLAFWANLSGYGTAKQLALIFGFQSPAGDGRVLVYTDAGKIGDQTLASTDNQFLIEMDVPDHPFYLYFIHAGGDWFFRGLSGYVV